MTNVPIIARTPVTRMTDAMRTSTSVKPSTAAGVGRRRGRLETFDGGPGFLIRRRSQRAEPETGGRPLKLGRRATRLSFDGRNGPAASTERPGPPNTCALAVDPADSGLT